MAIEFTECSSLSITYDATGKVSMSLGVLRDDMQPLKKNYNNPSFGERSFDLIVMSANQQPIIGSGKWAQWSLQLEGVTTS